MERMAIPLTLSQEITVKESQSNWISRTSSTVLEYCYGTKTTGRTPSVVENVISNTSKINFVTSL